MNTRKKSSKPHPTGKITRPLSRAVRWTPAEWREIERAARARGTTESDVIRAAVAAYLGLIRDGFDVGITMAELRTAISKNRKGRSAAADGE